MDLAGRLKSLTAFPGGIIAIALLLYAPEALAWSGELGQGF